MCECRICGWTGEAEILNVREMMYNTGENFDYFECRNCHCLQIVEVPKDLGDYYRENYYSYTQPKIKRRDNAQIDKTRVLDVGCGAGAFLCELAEHGLSNLIGCDPFIENDIEYENGVRIYKCDIHEMTGQFDQIYMNDSFEHVTDPHEVMESIERLLAPDGVAIIKIPIYPNVAFDMFGANWYQIDAPRHLFLHSKESMEYLAREHGLTIVKKEYDSLAGQFICSFLYSKDIPFKNQTEALMYQFFSNSDLLELKQASENANQNEYGDHAAFYLMHNERS